MTTDIKVYIKLKGTLQNGCLAWWRLKIIRKAITNEVIREIEHITLFVGRMWKAKEYREWTRCETCNWDNWFSHIVSHEYMHKILYHLVGSEATTGFDKILGNGSIPGDENKIRIGIPINLEE